jgi:hypothetical protein
MYEEENIAQQIVPLSCDIIVYRALRNGWVVNDTSSILFDAFMLRCPPKATKVEEGVSLVFTAKKCLKIIKTSKYAASLTIKQIRDIGESENLHLDVILNNPSNSNHAEIRGLPCPISERDKLQRVAGLLAKQCQLIKLYDP